MDNARVSARRLRNLFFLRLEAMCASCACGHAADKPLGASRDTCSNPCVCHEVKIEGGEEREKKKKSLKKIQKITKQCNSVTL